ncbi:hypothetical protein GH733_014916 [Mirounga leonina]|nr:hypothetical protein GH733_014916 [Mirounga leonina]
MHPPGGGLWCRPGTGMSPRTPQGSPTTQEPGCMVSLEQPCQLRVLSRKADKWEHGPELEFSRKRTNSWTCCPLAESGYFDVSDKEDKWIQIFMEKGDIRTPPASHWMKTTP